jgi:hypothetical protein
MPGALAKTSQTVSARSARLLGVYISGLPFELHPDARGRARTGRRSAKAKKLSLINMAPEILERTIGQKLPAVVGMVFADRAVLRGCPARCPRRNRESQSR